MGKEILMATLNPHKKERFQHYLDRLGLSVVNFADLGLEVDIIEDGKTPEENALIKAQTAFEVLKMPSFGVDYWLFIDGLLDDRQPGPFVRRIKNTGGQRYEASDDEMIDYYKRIVESLGGQTKGNWVSAVGLVIDTDVRFVEKFTREIYLPQ
jgi:8-oxo-dGTP diphosphatase